MILPHLKLLLESSKAAEVHKWHHPQLQSTSPQDCINMAMKLPSLPQSSQRTTCDRKSFLTYQNERCCETVAFRDSRSRQTARRARRRVWEGPARPVPSPGAVQDHSVPSGAVNPKESQHVKPHRPRHRGNRSISHVKEEREPQPFLSFPFRLK